MVHTFPVLYQRVPKLIRLFAEIGHVVARHTAERISSQVIRIALAIALQVVGLDSLISSLFNTYFLELPNSRTQELEGKFHLINHGS